MTESDLNKPYPPIIGFNLCLFSGEIIGFSVGQSNTATFWEYYWALIYIHMMLAMASYLAVRIYRSVK